ncbi:hypothetical protein M885DRAFT_520663 [Pelagophyceae sp. CCMP2097]|nr:hypothetical protein M885DRAFT_520663 [Pelagophyceae sp. CCMP2097]
MEVTLQPAVGFRRRAQAPVVRPLSPEEPKDRSEGYCFPVLLVALVASMVIVALWSASTPQSHQHEWLHLREELPPPAEAVVSQRPLQQNQGLPTGPEVPQPEPPSSTTRVRCETTTGPITIDVRPDWAPLGAARFLDMVDSGFFSSRVALFRAVKGFLCQTGIAGDPAVYRAFKKKGDVPDDAQWLTIGSKEAEVFRPMKRGYLSFAGGGANNRGTEFFFAFRDLRLGASPWEVPFATLVGAESFAAMDRWYVGYGDIKAYGGTAPAQGRMYSGGLAYLQAWPDLDYIDHCEVAPARI